jgi:glycosyltransferase involved in cell wall biosynthesis
VNIAVVCQYYYPEPFRVHEVCEALARRGHQVTVLTGVPNYPMGVIPKAYRHGQMREELRNGVHIFRVRQFPRKPGRVGLALNYISFALSACAKVFAFDKEFDVIFVYQLSPILMVLPAILLKKRLRKKLFLYCLDLWPDSLIALGVKPNHPLYKVMYRVSKWCYCHADHIACTSGMFTQYFKDVLKVGDVFCSHIPQFADEVFVGVLTIPHDEVNLVFAGNIGEMQSVETILRAAALLKEPDARWHIVGDGSAYDRCKKLAGELEVTGRVTFYGRLPLERMPEIYAMADAMLVTLKENETVSLTLPGKVQSYMVAGKAILGAANGEIARVISDAQCGLCCKAEDPGGLAEIASRFIHEPDRERYGKNARRYYDQHFTITEHMDAVEQALMQLTAAMDHESITDRQCLRH